MSDQISHDDHASSDLNNGNDVNVDRRDAMLKLAKYTAPAMLVMLTTEANALPASGVN